MRSFLAFVGFFSNHIAKFAEIAEPLFEILRAKTVKKRKKQVIFQWNDKAQEAFIQLKVKLTTEPILAFPDFKKQFIVHTDASNFALGAQLSQENNNLIHPSILHQKL